MFVSLFSSLGQHGLVSQLDPSPPPPYVVLEGRGLENDLSILHLLKWQRHKLTFFNLSFFFFKVLEDHTIEKYISKLQSLAQTSLNASTSCWCSLIFTFVSYMLYDVLVIWPHVCLSQDPCFSTDYTYFGDTSGNVIWCHHLMLPHFCRNQKISWFQPEAEMLLWKVNKLVLVLLICQTVITWYFMKLPKPSFHGELLPGILIFRLPNSIHPSPINWSCKSRERLRRI